MTTVDLRHEESVGRPLVWHSVSASDVLSELATDRGGLGTEDVARRLAEHGPNVIPRAGAESAWRVLLRQINNPLIWVLVGAGTLAVSLGKPIDGAVVLSVVVANAAIGFLQEFRAGKEIEALIDMVPDFALVVRNGMRLTVPVADLVPGDIVQLASGDKVPADVRLLDVRNLRIEEAALTGESVPVAKGDAASRRKARSPISSAWPIGGTLITYGTGTAVVVATAGATVLGRISSLLEGASPLETPLTQAMAQVGVHSRTRGATRSRRQGAGRGVPSSQRRSSSSLLGPTRPAGGRKGTAASRPLRFSTADRPADPEAEWP